jgi:hypothetical protein
MEIYMRFRSGALLALAGMLAALGLWVHQGSTEENDAGVIIPILSTTDCVGYTSPCG